MRRDPKTTSARCRNSLNPHRREFEDLAFRKQMFSVIPSPCQLLRAAWHSEYT